MLQFYPIMYTVIASRRSWFLAARQSPAQLGIASGWVSIRAIRALALLNHQPSQ